MFLYDVIPVWDAESDRSDTENISRMHFSYQKNLKRLFNKSEQKKNNFHNMMDNNMSILLCLIYSIVGQYHLKEEGHYFPHFSELVPAPKRFQLYIFQKL